MNREEMIARSGDSHLERLFSAALWDAGWRHCSDPDIAMGSLGAVRIAWQKPSVRMRGVSGGRCEAVPQVRFPAAGDARIVDWLFFPSGSDRNEFLVVVELDGHSFHERTPDQASRDRASDRSIQLSGSLVLRFTHLELTRYMPACMNDLTTAIRVQEERLRDAWVAYLGRHRNVAVDFDVADEEPPPSRQPSSFELQVRALEAYLEARKG